jgi:tetratricopeptide (TPR) repeat protein
MSGGIFAQGVVTFLVIFIFKLDTPHVINLQSDIADIIDFQQITPAHLFVGINLAFIATNLFPIKRKVKGQIHSTDGYKIITSLKRKTQDLLMDMKAVQAYSLFEDKKYGDAEVRFSEICHLYPSSLIPRVNLSAVLIRQCKIDEAIECLEPLLEECDKDQYASIMYNNIAWAYLLKGDKDSQQKADIYSAHALKIDPDNRIVRDSRGCILIELGAIDEGVNILEENAHLRKPIKVKPDNHVEVAYLAYASYIRQDLATAHMCLQKVLSSSSKLEPDARLIVKRIEERIMSD